MIIFFIAWNAPEKKRKTKGKWEKLRCKPYTTINQLMKMHHTHDYIGERAYELSQYTTMRTKCI